jgi:hypothetical protein
MSDPTGATPRSIWTGENFRALLACVTALVE